jgi:hypothetical protein
VLRVVLPCHQHPKLALRWVGPCRIVQVLTDFIFILQHLVTGGKCEVHGSRILFFRTSDFDVAKEVIEHLEYQTRELYTVSEFVDVRVWQGSVEVKARWRGHEAWESTWESAKAMREDVQYFFKITSTPRIRAGLLSRSRFSSSITSNTLRQAFTLLLFSLATMLYSAGNFIRVVRQASCVMGIVLKVLLSYDTMCDRRCVQQGFLIPLPLVVVVAYKLSMLPGYASVLVRGDAPTGG